MPKKYELLCPVGNAEMLKAAVRCGADAVYFGAEHFNARRNAENFSNEAIKEAIKYCHINGVKAYLTLNIIVGDSEFDDAVKMARAAYRAGIDALIVADIGLARYLSRRFPRLELHASTQLSVHSPSALPLLSKAGFSRVVLSREMSLDAIKEFCKEADNYKIEVEVFVHGALCMSVSGQCYLSAMLGSRSGNRGLCAGPCRLPFAAKNGTGYDLSLKDLSYIEHISELKEAGVVSFKVEGRMKRPEYVAAAASVLRRVLDGEKAEQTKIELLRSVFSRQGFTDRYLSGNTGAEMFGIRTKDDVTAAPATFAKLHELYRNERQQIPVKAEFVAKSGEAARLALGVGDTSVTVSGEVPTLAQGKPLQKDFVFEAISKTGGTPYFITDFSADLGEDITLSRGALNNMRREAIEILNNERAKTQIVAEQETNRVLPSAKMLCEPKRYCFFSKVSQLPESLDRIDTVILPLEADFNGLSLKQNINWAVDIPRGIKSEVGLCGLLRAAKKKGFTAAVCGNIAAIELAKKEGFQIIGGFGLNIYNSETAEFYRESGAEKQVVSFELKMGDAARINVEQKGIICYGKLPLMLTANCPIKNGIGCAECKKGGVLTDRLGEKFPVRCRLGFSEVFNPHPVELSDKRSDLSAFDFILFYFTDETESEIPKILARYDDSIAPKGDYTRGLYYRGVE